MLFQVLPGIGSGAITNFLRGTLCYDRAAALASRAVDPCPQAMVLTAIVIGLGVTMLLVAIALRLYQRYGTYDIGEMRRLRG